MADKITDPQVTNLLTILRADAPIDAKVAQVTAVKSGIKQFNVPDTCVAPLFDALRTASSSQHAVLVNAGFTALNHLLTRLSRQEPKYLAKEAARTMPLLVEKMGDQKEKFRVTALQALGTLYKAAPIDVERSVRNTAMVGKNARAKETSLQWLLQMHKENGLQFRGYVPTLMELLEDADPGVRDVAKTTVIELFRNAPNTAKSDLKRQLKNFKVRPAIEQAIVKELAPTSSASTIPNEPDDVPPPSRPNLAASLSSLSSEQPITPMPESRPDAVEPSYVNTQRELDDIFREMQPHFEGRESEHNWLKREESITKLRRLMAGNAATDFSDSFLAGIRGLLDGIIKAIISLRTSLSKEGCSLVQDVANTYGPAMDPMVELLMQTFIKLSAATKKIASQLANTTIDTIIAKASYTPRIMQHVWGACQDKNVQPRLYATGWLKTLLNKEAGHKNHIEHNGGLDVIEKCIKKGLNDPNPGVREKMRSTYWTFAGIWPARAEAIMNALDAQAQKLLQNDPNNPNSPKKPEVAARPGLGLSKSTMGSSKPSLRETMISDVPFLPCADKLEHVRCLGRICNDSTKRPSSRGNSRLVGCARVTPKRTAPSSRPGHVATVSESSLPTPTKTIGTHKVTASPSGSPARPRAVAGSSVNGSSPSKAHEDFTLVVPTIPSFKSSPPKEPTLSGLKVSPARDASPAPAAASPTSAMSEAAPTDIQVVAATPPRSLKVFEDPFTEGEETPRPKPVFTVPVLEDKPVNAAAASLVRPGMEANGDEADKNTVLSPQKVKQDSRLLDSAMAKIKTQSLDVHGFRKLQGIIRDNKVMLTDEKFDSLLLGLFEYLQSPLEGVTPEKVQDVKAQILATIKLLLKKARDSFQPHISRGLEALLATRSCYDARTHIVAGLELLADELVTIGDAQEIATVLTKRLSGLDMDSAPGCRSLSMGLHMLGEMIEARAAFMPTDAELSNMTVLCSRCLESSESAVRMDAVLLCVALHARVGDTRFWDFMKGVRDDPKSLITYYIVKRQREASTA
ncbi:ARM repeat-containing protein [Pleurostoma richardsiae]|uniref:ARM repeat-containing protein n=1 Tax=Pleurostoma richardsiae TaxID=41990 RepID=A0AA38VKB9_9PEZI|nr:ARM repeat-containing protein [Pleurostoma richardsiae]